MEETNQSSEPETPQETVVPAPVPPPHSRSHPCSAAISWTGSSSFRGFSSASPSRAASIPRAGRFTAVQQ